MNDTAHAQEPPHPTAAAPVARLADLTNHHHRRCRSDDDDDDNNDQVCDSPSSNGKRMYISSTTNISPTKRVNKAVKSTARPSTSSSTSSSRDHSRSPLKRPRGIVSSTAALRNDDNDDDDEGVGEEEDKKKKKKKDEGDEDENDELERPRTSRRDSVDSIIDITDSSVTDSRAGSEPSLSKYLNVAAAEAPGAGAVAAGKRSAATSSVDSSGFGKRTRASEGVSLSPRVSSGSTASTSAAKLDDFMPAVGQKRSSQGSPKYQANLRLFERRSKAISRAPMQLTVRELSKFRRLQGLLGILIPSGGGGDGGSSSSEPVKSEAESKPSKSSSTESRLSYMSGASSSRSTSASSSSLVAGKSGPAGESFAFLADPEMTRFAQKYNSVYRPSLRHEVLVDGRRKHVTLSWTLERVDPSAGRSKLTPPVASSAAETDFARHISFYELYGSRLVEHQNQAWLLIEAIKASKPPVSCTLTDFDPGTVYCFKVRFVDHDGLRSPYSDVVNVRV